MVYIVTIRPVPCSVPGDGMCQGSAIITSRSMQQSMFKMVAVNAVERASADGTSSERSCCCF